MTEEQNQLDEESSELYQSNDERREAIRARIRKRAEETGRLIEPGTIYTCTEPEFCGRIPVRTEIEVLPADDPDDKKLGWVIVTYNGCEVCPIDSDVPITSRWGLRPGMKVRAWNMEWTVVWDGWFSIALDREKSKGILVFGEDDRKCWACPGIINKNSSWYRKPNSRIVGFFRTLFGARRGDSHE